MELLPETHSVCNIYYHFSSDARKVLPCEGIIGTLKTTAHIKRIKKQTSWYNTCSAPAP